MSHGHRWHTASPLRESHPLAPRAVPQSQWPRGSLHDRPLCPNAQPRWQGVYRLLFDGVYTRATPTARPVFHRLPPPTDADIAVLLARVQSRVRGLLSRRGRWPDAEAGSDPFAVQEPLFASAVAASLQGRIALGLRAGQPVRRLRSAATATATGRRSARLEGFSLHADVAVPARRRDQLEKLCRYIVRPPLALERLTESPGGQLLYQLRRAWSDGSTALLLEPLELLERLAALVPPPRRPLLAYHGLLAPRGAATLCPLSSKARNLKRLGIGEATSWAKRPPLHGLDRLANGIRVESRGIDLPGGTRHHLSGLKEAPPDELANHPRTHAEPIGGVVEREHGLRRGPVVVHEMQPFAQRQDPRGRPRVADARAQAEPVEAGGDLMIGPGAGHAPHDAFGIRAGPVAMLARPRSEHAQLGMSAARPVDDEHDLARGLIDIHDDLLDEQARDALLDAHLAARRVPHGAEIGGQRFERLSIDAHG
jgi:hypothetical protein